LQERVPALQGGGGEICYSGKMTKSRIGFLEFGGRSKEEKKRRNFAGGRRTYAAEIFGKKSTNTKQGKKG